MKHETSWLHAYNPWHYERLRAAAERAVQGGRDILVVPSVHIPALTIDIPGGSYVVPVNYNGHHNLEVVLGEIQGVLGSFEDLAQCAGVEVRVPGDIAATNQWGALKEFKDLPLRLVMDIDDVDYWVPRLPAEQGCFDTVVLRWAYHEDAHTAAAIGEFKRRGFQVKVRGQEVPSQEILEAYEALGVDILECPQ